MRRLRRSRGQALVEFALVLPIVLLLLFGVIDFGWMIFNYAQLYNSMREGLRYGSVSGFGATPQYLSCDAIRQRIIDLAGFSGIQPGNITIVYDDGRPATLPTDPSIVGTCSTPPPLPTSFSQNSSYTDTNGKGARAVEQGDRVVIDITVTVPFLTPFIRPLVTGGGIAMHLHAARSIFPNV